MILNGDVFSHLKGLILTSHQCFSLSIQKKTYEIIEPSDCYQKTWISQPSSGLNKIHTWKVCTRGDDSQPNIAIIFRGRGVGFDEKAAYHPDVYVFWQTNGWDDTECSANWVYSTLKESVKDIEKIVLFVDNYSTANQ